MSEERLELSTSGLWILCSNQLSYSDEMAITPQMIIHLRVSIQRISTAFNRSRKDLVSSGSFTGVASDWMVTGIVTGVEARLGTDWRRIPAWLLPRDPGRFSSPVCWSRYRGFFLRSPRSWLSNRKWPVELNFLSKEGSQLDVWSIMPITLWCRSPKRRDKFKSITGSRYDFV